MIRAAGAFVAIAASTLGLACGDDADVSIDDDAGAGDDGGDASVAIEWPELSVGTTVDPDDPTRLGPDAQPADLSCLGAWDFSAPGEPREVRLRLVIDAIAEGAPLAGACIRVHDDDMIGAPSPCGDADVITDAMGIATVSIRGDAPFALRVHAHEGTTATDSTPPTLLFDVLASRPPLPFPGGDVGLYVPSRAGFSLIPLLFGHRWTRGTAVIGASLADCRGRQLFGARLRVAHEDGTYVEHGDAMDDPAIGYFDASGSLTPAQPWTHNLGTGAMVNAPVTRAGAAILVEAWGRIAGEDEPRVVACERVVVEADTVSALEHVEPLRRSHPRCPGLGIR